jgi:hypothetical protein
MPVLSDNAAIRRTPDASLDEIDAAARIIERVTDWPPHPLVTQSRIMIARNHMQAVFAAFGEGTQDAQTVGMGCGHQTGKRFHFFEGASKIGTRPFAGDVRRRLPQFEKIPHDEEVDTFLALCRKLVQKSFESFRPPKILSGMPAAISLSADAEMKITDKCQIAWARWGRSERNAGNRSPLRLCPAAVGADPQPSYRL